MSVSVTSLAFFVTSLIRLICPRQAVLPGSSLIHNPAGERLSNLQEASSINVLTRPCQCPHSMPETSAGSSSICILPDVLTLGPQERRKSWLALLCKSQCSQGRKIQPFIHSTNTDATGTICWHCSGHWGHSSEQHKVLSSWRCHPSGETS